ncbi:MAG TPA: DUF1634 domain-containing protein [Symbiobacteriaceae bacterium]|jgi:hypothetical protein
MELTQETPARVMSIELVLARVLRVGSVIAAALVGAGIFVMIMGVSPDLGSKLITWGLGVLVSTPVMRVLVAGLVFLWEKDYRFASFCAVVLSALLAGILLGGLGG